MKNKIHIAIADDGLLYRQGLVELFKNFEEIKVLFNVGSGKEALENLKKFKPEILLLDIQMPGMEGQEVLDIVKVKYPALKVIILTGHFTEAYIYEFIRIGVAGFLSKNTGIEKVVDTIHSVHVNGHHFDPKVSSIMAKIINQSKLPTNNGIYIQDETLTEREINIIRMICADKSNKEIAKELRLSIRTVEGHRLHIRKKTNCKSIMDFINYATEHNLIKIN